MEHYGVARMTIRNALRVLLDEGLVPPSMAGACMSGPGRRCAAWPRTGSPSGTVRKAWPRSAWRLRRSAPLPGWTC